MYLEHHHCCTAAPHDRPEVNIHERQRDQGERRMQTAHKIEGNFQQEDVKESLILLFLLMWRCTKYPCVVPTFQEI